MKKLYFLLAIFLFSTVSFAQVKIIDKVTKNISLQHPGTVYELRADELEDGRIKITFYADTLYNFNRGEIYLNSYTDFEALHQIILKGFEEKKSQTINVELADSRIAITYDKGVLFFPTDVYLTHSYNNSLYQTKTTKRISKKEINSLFNTN